MSTTFNSIQGLDELKRKLAALAPKAERKILLSSWRKTGNTLRDAAKAKVSSKSGALKKSIKVVSQRAKRHQVRHRVVAEALRASKKFPGGYPYGLAVEAGHEFPGKGKNTHKKRITPHESEFGTSFVRPHPFMRPAWEEKKDSLVSTFADEIGKGIEKLAVEKA